MQEGNNGGGFKRMDPTVSLADMVAQVKQTQPQQQSQYTYPPQNQYPPQNNYGQQYPQNPPQVTQYPPGSYYDQSAVIPPQVYNQQVSPPNQYPQNTPQVVQNFPQQTPPQSPPINSKPPGAKADLRNTMLADLENMSVEEVERFNKQVEQIALTKKYSAYIENFLEVLKTIDQLGTPQVCVISRVRSGFDFKIAEFNSFNKEQNYFYFNNKNDNGSVIIIEPITEPQPEPQVSVTAESMKGFTQDVITQAVSVEEPGLISEPQEN